MGEAEAEADSVRFLLGLSGIVAVAPNGGRMGCSLDAEAGWTFGSDGVDRGGRGWCGAESEDDGESWLALTGDGGSFTCLVSWIWRALPGSLLRPGIVSAFISGGRPDVILAADMNLVLFTLCFFFPGPPSALYPVCKRSWGREGAVRGGGRGRDSKQATKGYEVTDSLEQ
jgi:hypothetical protein